MKATMMDVEIDLEVATDKGRIDGILELDDRIYIIEFKYGKPGSNMDALTKQAIRQILDKKYEERFLDDPRPRFLLGVGFTGKKIGHKLVEKNC